MNKGQKAKIAGPSVSQQVAALEQRLADLEADYAALVQENAQLRKDAAQHYRLFCRCSGAGCERCRR